MRKLKLEELGRIAVDEFKKQPKTPLILVLDNIRSLQNVGSLFRTADGFAVEKIILCGITGKPPHREIQRSALGATESVDWEYQAEISETLKNLKADGYHICLLEQTDASQMIQDATGIFKQNNKFVLVVGNEVEGVSNEALPLADIALEIPQVGTKHSFNVSVASGIALWWFYENLQLKIA